MGYKVLFVGGTWDKNGGRPSGLINKMTDALQKNEDVELTSLNGGFYNNLKTEIEKCTEYDFVFWFANVIDNSIEKIRNVKDINPYCLLITSKRNDNNKYNFMDLEQRALQLKANLVFEFAKQESGVFKMRVFDPLGALWYEGKDINEAVDSTIRRLRFLKSITRQGTIHGDMSKEDIFAQFFEKDNSGYFIPDAETKEFISLVRDNATVFHDILQPAEGVKRFLGNCSMRPRYETRCMNGFPSIRKGDYIFVSRRNINKEEIDINGFVPVLLDENDTLYYYGDNKPSIDTPIQTRLYKLLPNINFMMHAHVYTKGGLFTDRPVPCGAIEEVDEIVKLIDKEYGGDMTHSEYKINLIGHGCLIMGSSPEFIRAAEYYARSIPEAIS